MKVEFSVLPLLFGAIEERAVSSGAMLWPSKGITCKTIGWPLLTGGFYWT